MRHLVLAVIFAVSVPTLVHAEKARPLREGHDIGESVRRLEERASAQGGEEHCSACLKFGLDFGRAHLNQMKLGEKRGGVFVGRDATGTRKVVNLEIESQGADTFGIRTHEAGGTSTLRQFKLGADGIHHAQDGASFRLIRGRGIYDYNDANYKDDKQAGNR